MQVEKTEEEKCRGRDDGENMREREKTEERNRGNEKKAQRGRAQTDYLPLWDKQGGMQDGTNLNDKATDFS